MIYIYVDGADKWKMLKTYASVPLKDFFQTSVFWLLIHLCSGLLFLVMTVIIQANTSVFLTHGTFHLLKNFSKAKVNKQLHILE